MHGVNKADCVESGSTLSACTKGWDSENKGVSNGTWGAGDYATSASVETANGSKVPNQINLHSGGRNRRQQR